MVPRQRLVRKAALVGALWACLPAAALADAAVPPWVTIQASEVGEVYADTAGMTVYAANGDDLSMDGFPACRNECVQLFPPVLATDRDQAIGKWKPVKRQDGSMQWTLDGKPLHIFSRDKVPGDARADNWAARWSAMRYTPPVPTMIVPAGVTFQRRGRGYLLADVHGLTLYHPASGQPCEDSCTFSWKPLVAPDLSGPVGDWTIVRRADGTRQWAFRANPLYTFSRDAIVGDVNGDGLDGWEAARAQ